MLFYLRHLLSRRAARRELHDLGRCRVNFSHRFSELRIRFLVDLFPADQRFVGEAGVSYLIEAEHHRVLFDLGFNRKNAAGPPLRTNLAALGLEPLRVDGVFISHNHLDHVGGLDNQRHRRPGAGVIELGEVPVWAPIALDCGAQGRQICEPTELLPGLASTGPLPAPLYFLGPLHEHAMLAALERGGLVLITGCGHPGIAEMVRFARAVTGEPVEAVVGGLHLIASRGRTRAQKYLAANQPPWRLPGPRGVRAEIETLRDLGVKQIVPSAHDSCDESLAIMQEVFGAGYHPLRAGGEIVFA